MRLCDVFLPILAALLGLPLTTAASDDHVVVNVVNGFVYVDLGSRDGVSAGDKVEILGVGTIELDMCGEVVCRGRLPSSSGVAITKGMKVRLAGTTTTPASAEPSESEPPPTTPKKPMAAPSASASATTTEPESLARLPYREGSTAPSGYRFVSKPSDTTVNVGLAFFGLTYGLAITDALITNAASSPPSGASSASWLYLPVFGPWILLAASDERKCSVIASINVYRCTGRKVGDNFLIFDGLGQLGSAVTIAAGYLLRDKFYLRNDIKAQVHVTPFVAAHSYGLGLVGSF